MKKDINLLWTLKDVSDSFNVGITTLRYRCQRLKIKPLVNLGHQSYVLTIDEVDDVINYMAKGKVRIPEIIYVTQTTEIYESKLNYLTENQL